MNKSKALIYVVDDDPSIQRALTLLLHSHGFKVAAFSSAEAFLAFKHPRQTACLLLDVRLPELNGPALQDIMCERQLDIPIVFITGYGDIPMGVKAMKGGAVDFLPKPFIDQDLLNAIERAIAKSKVQNRSGAEVDQIKRRISTLSPRELEVFHFVAQGLMNKQIASRRGTALQTIKVHRGRVMQKMQAKTVTELIHFAQKAGLVPS
ncbi:MAG: response regulator transcription factor [Candidatus Omnitrophica bacterium]|nr:response regulator transcription factor [Candidatus Omnitrophota bacterium]